MRFRVYVIAVTLLLGISQATAARATEPDYDNMYPTNNLILPCDDSSMSGRIFCQTDNAGVSYFAQDSIGAIGRGNIIDNAGGQLDPTDLYTNYDSSPSYSGSAETDIIYQESTDLPSGTIGVTWCDNAVDTVRCDQHYVRTIAGNPSHAVICHETGHSVGLTHGSDAYPRVASDSTTSLGCMRTPLTSDTTLGAHNVSEINATY
jgi:hypothetical protein